MFAAGVDLSHVLQVKIFKDKKRPHLKDEKLNILWNSFRSSWDGESEYRRGHMLTETLMTRETEITQQQMITNMENQDVNPGCGSAFNWIQGCM